jgi:hypothetical protein
LSSLRIKFWTHQETNGAKSKTGEAAIWVNQYSARIADVNAGATLLRTIVTGWFTIGLHYNPNSEIPPADVIGSTSIDLAVLDDPTGSLAGTPSRLNDVARDIRTVWQANLACTSQNLIQGVGNGVLWVGNYVIPQSSLGESFAKRGPHTVSGANSYLLWNLQSVYALNEAAFKNQYNVAPHVWDWEVSGQVSVDQLWDSAPV